MKQSTFEILLLLSGFALGALMGWGLHRDLNKPKDHSPKPCCTCGYTVIEKGVHVNNCGDTVRIDKLFDSQNTTK